MNNQELPSRHGAQPPAQEAQPQAQDAQSPVQDPQPPAQNSPDLLSDTAAPAGGPPTRSRGLIALLAENCTVCMLCVRECPDWCLHIEGHTETVGSTGTDRPAAASSAGAPPVTGGRATQRHVLDRFAIDYGLCMYCGICVEVCPFDALHWSPELVPAAGERVDLVAERVSLEEWSVVVPPPTALDSGAPVARELTRLSEQRPGRDR